ncbi:anthranilate phosphoribosyltransferase [Paenibacillus hunanensis]|uniref:anthranilate phosphoribosyltransferase n=1 Tax=Paenibacillus hunanensis TaxID=539262 RepID=UPI002025BC86|nr:anthranilate phosphoribosyltransferase [Paenibacillus hunanensis]MCL9662853.1 anthranilate phosphoribosyltransferase [Paenibacillus hunanensis]WPP43126.1 anthranilate phosphoribosyltransferase [Paenibacillus hunanensis]
MHTAETIQQAIMNVIEGKHLTREQSYEVMSAIMNGEATPSQIGGLLTSLRMKGETVEEITGFAEAMRSSGGRVPVMSAGLLDTCGTGGSGIHKFNISTVSAIIAASVSVRVAKHGNRSASGKAGSADVLEALGVNIGLNAVQAASCLNEIGICFLFAQVFHPSMKHAAATRRELGVRTVFNMLGPLTNPAGADRQLIGLYDGSKIETVAHTLKLLGLERAMVVASQDGLDEISIAAPTRIAELRDGEVHTYEVTPQDFGLSSHPLEHMLGGNAEENASIIRRVLQGERGAYRDVVLANSAACIYLAGKANSLAEGAAIAAQAIDSGAAANKLQQLIQTTEAFSYVS